MAGNTIIEILNEAIDEVAKENPTPIENKSEIKPDAGEASEQDISEVAASVMGG